MQRQNKILVVEDDPILSSNLNELLTSFGYSVSLSCNGIEGLKFLKSGLPDLILCDVMMNGMDGFSFFEEVKQVYTYSVPFIFLTARSDLDSLRCGMNLGADDYIFKPYKAGELLKVIETRLKKHNIASIVTDTESAAKLKYSDIIFVDNSGKNIPLNVCEIKFISSNGDYSIVNSSKIKNLIIKQTLKEWEEILPVSQFIRIHRSTIVNIEFIDKIEKGFNRELLIKIKDYDKNLVASIRYSAKLKEKLFK